MYKILIVEDDFFFRTLFCDLLKGEGYEVDTASDGQEGFSLLALHKYDLVITDLVMPVISGMEILARAKETDPSLDVIMVTGNADLESAIFSLKHGARDYLIKPVNQDEFLHSVARCLEQRRILDENEELKKMLNLFQTSQAINGCLELDRIQHLTFDSIVREVGSGRALGMFPGDGALLELKEAKGFTPDLANRLKDSILGDIGKHLPHDPHTPQISLLRFAGLLQDDVISGAAVEECYLVQMFVNNAIQGVIALFNDPGCSLPDISPHKKNILFLLEQAGIATHNASSYTAARDMLFIDELSGLYNYRYLDIALERELKRAVRYASHLAVLFMDIDVFKSINDKHGHLVGSGVLKEMGDLLKRSVREVDIVIRYGGDEYTVILVETSPATAAVVAERIRSRIESHQFMKSIGLQISLTASIGFACCPEDAISKQDLLEMADHAMYAGKASGKNCVYRINSNHLKKSK